MLIECIIWKGAKNQKGYGLRSINNKTKLVHRLEWEKYNGPIPDKLKILHKCDNPSCYNIDHLFLGTQQDNINDMLDKNRQGNQLKTHCCNGHEFNDENTYIYKGARTCRVCNRISHSKHYREALWN